MDSDRLPKLSVSDLTSMIKTTLESGFYGLVVEGEISGFRPASTGHWYFSLKDQKAVISCAMWRSSVPRVGFIPKDGMKVIVTGSLSVFEPRGTYQIICTSMKVAGEGDILAMLEERKRKFAALGYFDQELKKPIPKRPNRVAVVTSPTGAALQDILQITGRRNNGMDIIILPAVVQGSDAAPTIAKRIDEVNEFLLADVIIVGRGGGSIEDLLPFSEECVIEAIHRSRIPVISAVGHEIDWAISDYVADLRAPTPSAAAELVCESSLDQREKVSQLCSAMYDALYVKLNEVKLRLAAFSPSNARLQLDSRLNRIRMQLDSETQDMQHSIHNLITLRSSRAELLKHKIMALSPLAVLDRGYSIVTDSEGRTLKSISQTRSGDVISVKMSDGSVSAKVQEVSDGR
ncbi:MAG TPA: exodeoxyribonuclease VII large subunit [Sphaerochaeta sp.]|jgi:exodeoxyribonuclease VII large subunit|nr:exodeoxyribonuclease VII large subunit [Sphaerochaeta sp.]